MTSVALRSLGDFPLLSWGESGSADVATVVHSRRGDMLN